MKNIALVYNANREKDIEYINSVKDSLEKKGITSQVYKGGIDYTEVKNLSDDVDLIIVLGGDGTFLGTSRAVVEKNIPILGINTGNLGFLTEGNIKDFESIISAVLATKYEIEERTMLSINLNGNKLYALNDAVISRGTNRKMLNMILKVDGNKVADYVSDGLIISTPTGSTAYALSAGGAVMDPEIDGIEIVPICAHSLTNRPHIISDKRKITISFEDKKFDGVMLQLDGQENIVIKPEHLIEITRSKYSTKLIRLANNKNSFYNRIRKKFHWGEG